MNAPEPITSLQNPQIKHLVRLRQRREREREGLILIEGGREVSRALAAGITPQRVYICPELLSDDARQTLAALGEGTELSRLAFEKVSGRENPDGLLVVASTPQTTWPTLGQDALVVVLHGLEKPGNVGAILRTADAAGADAVLVLGRGADAYSPNVIRSSQGSVFSLPVLTPTEAEALAWLSREGLTWVACTPDAQQDYWDAPLTGRVALVLGAEHQGLPTEWRGGDLPVRIPMFGQADSLNVATAAALVLYECVRQRGQR